MTNPTEPLCKVKQMNKPVQLVRHLHIRSAIAWDSTAHAGHVPVCRVTDGHQACLTYCSSAAAHRNRVMEANPHMLLVWLFLAALPAILTTTTTNVCSISDESTQICPTRGSELLQHSKAGKPEIHFCLRTLPPSSSQHLGKKEVLPRNMNICPLATKL